MAHIVITAVTAIADGYGCRYRPHEIAEVSDELAAAWVAAGHAEYHESGSDDQAPDDGPDEDGLDGGPEAPVTPERTAVEDAAVAVEPEQTAAQDVGSGDVVAEAEPAGGGDEREETAVQQPVGDTATPDTSGGQETRTAEQPRTSTRRAARTAARRPARGSDEK